MDQSYDQDVNSTAIPNRSACNQCGYPTYDTRTRAGMSPGRVGGMPYADTRRPTTSLEAVDVMPLAMCYVPMQQWNEVYESCHALKAGTIFPELVKPFWIKCGLRVR